MDRNEKISALSEIIKKYAEEILNHPPNSEPAIYCDEIINYAHIIRSVVTFSDAQGYIRNSVPYELNDLCSCITAEISPEGVEYDLYKQMLTDIKALAQALR